MNKKINIKSNNNDMEMTKVIKILLIVIVVFGIVAFITAVATGEIKFGNGKNKEEVVIQYEEILAGETFNQDENTYFVLFFDYTSNDAALFRTLASKINTATTYPVYKVDLHKGFNQNYMTNDKSNPFPSNVDNLLVNGATLIRIDNKKVTEYLENKDVIKNYALNLSK